MPKHGSGWTLRLAILTLPMLGGGCVSVSHNALCEGTGPALARHAAALAETPDDAVALTGADLVALIDAGCGPRPWRSAAREGQRVVWPRDLGKA